MAYRSSRWLYLLILLAMLAIAAYLQYQTRVSSYRIEQAAPGQIVSEDHFAPAENLERIDLDRLNRAQHTLDIAMYSFTDRYLAEELLKLARRGVLIRIYRDREQYESEQRRAGQYHEDSTMAMFRGEANIQVRVKQNSRRDLMHLKAYELDGVLLRDGSANWSPAGEKAQDNNAHFTNDPAQIRAFHNDFEKMWARDDNQLVQ